MLRLHIGSKIWLLIYLCVIHLTKSYLYLFTYLFKELPFFLRGNTMSLESKNLFFIMPSQYYKMYTPNYNFSLFLKIFA